MTVSDEARANVAQQMLARELGRVGWSIGRLAEEIGSTATDAIHLTICAALSQRPSPHDEGVKSDCELCVGKCRGHHLGHPEDWRPEPGSRAASSPKLDEGVIAEVKEALRPFAERADRYNDSRAVKIEDDCQLWQLQDNSGMRVDITVGDLRNARRLLTLIEGGGE